MTHNQELRDACASHRERAERFLSFLGSLSSCLDLEPVASAVSQEQLATTRRKTQRFLRGDCNPRYRIALAGAYSVGKSQLINALLGRELLPEDPSETTFLPTILSGVSEGGPNSVWIRGLTHSEIEEILEAYAGELGSVNLPRTFAEVEAMAEPDLEELIAGISGHGRFDDLPNFLRALREPRLQEMLTSEGAAGALRAPEQLRDS